MEQKSPVCDICIGKVSSLVEQTVVPELECIYCEKADSELLYHGRPCCQGCYFKLRSKSPKKCPTDRDHVGSKTSRSIANISLSSSILSYRTARSNQTKLTKKIEDVIKDYKSVPSNQAYLLALKKKSRIYYISKQNEKISWKTFVDKVDGKSPLMIAALFPDRLIGAFLKEDLTIRKPKIQDPDCGVFMLFRQGHSFNTEYSTVQGNIVSFQNKVLSFGEPSSFCVQFDSMKIQTQLIDSFDLVDLQNLFVIRL